MAPDETDEQLMRKFQRGDARAFETLMRRHRTKVHSFLCRLVGDRARAEDLLQETFLRVVKGAAGWEPRAAVRTWLFAIARNLAADEARRRVFRETEPLDAPGPGGDPRPEPAEVDPARAPDEAAGDALVRPRLEAAIRALPAEQREVFLLREHAGLSFPEIAEATGANENTVKSRLRYALLALRERLAAEGIAPAAEPARAAR
ncbi:MAG TPA: RNA polymerase sigma factor [Anaeromyxobacteraceae bacterium]|nr:RNA polymerase sigma factor [Anaeromyxobacteraceae bacterium]